MRSILYRGYTFLLRRKEIHVGTPGTPASASYFGDRYYGNRYFGERYFG